MLPQREEIASVVVCEDDAVTLELLCDHLVADRFGALPAPSASDALRLCRYNQPDLLLLDLTLPDASGLDVLREIRDADGVDSRFDPRLPIIVLTGRGADADRVRGLESGADDYVLKPFHYPELRARIAAILRRDAAQREGPCRVGEIVIDPARRRVTVGEREVKLSNKEFSLLRALASRPDPGLLQGRAAARRLGLPHPRAHPHPRLPRQPAAPQARPRARPLRGQLLGRRLQAGRRMTDLAGIASGWPLAASMAVALTAQGLRAGRRRSALNEALHELRRPLQAIALAAPGMAGFGPVGSEGSVRLAAAALERLDREINGGPVEAVRAAVRFQPLTPGSRWGAGGRAPRWAGARWSCAGGRAGRSSWASAPSSRRRSTT